MNIVVNIGNTNIRFGLFEKNNCLKSWITDSKPLKDEKTYIAIFQNLYALNEIDSQSIDKIVIGSVVPNLTPLVMSSLETIHHQKPILVDRNTKSNVTHHSTQIGTDLYANAVAAHELYDESRKKIVIDFGTALTFLSVDEHGEIMGIVIAPGIITSLEALVKQTAQLPNINLSKTETILGKNTIACMQSGIMNGYASMVEGMITKINSEVKDNSLVITTGGLGQIFSDLVEKIDLNDQLHSLKGINLLAN